MLVVVSSGNIFILLLGWEGVGIISYLLINYWNLRIESNKSAIKALLLNKIGDFSIVFAGISFFNYFLNASNMIINYLTIFFKNELYLFLNFNINIFFFPLLFIVLAAISKSAQLIFCMWLPDAMEGPTPVSALIHSSTMVAAGYILLITYYQIFQINEKFSILIYFIGLLTNWLSTLVLLTTSDIKNTLANSTTAQIAYMITLLGSNFPISSLMQFVAHAFYKSLAFLSFGSLIYQVKDNQDIRIVSVLNIQNPLMIFCLMVSLLSFLGIPNFISHFGKLDLFSLTTKFNYFNQGFSILLLYSQLINFIGGLGLFLICINYKNNIKISKFYIVNNTNWENSYPLAMLSKVILALCCLILGNYLYSLSQYLEMLNIQTYSKKIFSTIAASSVNFPLYILIIISISILFLYLINDFKLQIKTKNVKQFIVKLANNFYIFTKSEFLYSMWPTPIVNLSLLLKIIINFFIFYILKFIKLIPNFKFNINISNTSYNYSQISSISNWYFDSNLVKIIIYTFLISKKLTIYFCNILTHPSYYFKIFYKLI